MSARTIVICSCVAIFCAVVGCGKKGALERVQVRGNVSFAGKPVQNGEIRFFPTQKTQGPVSGAPIVDGKYDVTQRGGVPVGSHRVEIEAFRSSKAYAKLNAEGGHRDQFLPEEYNVHSNLSADVSADSASKPLNFDLER